MATHAAPIPTAVPAPAARLLESLLQAYRQAGELRQHETAFHALPAAAHAGGALADTATLAEIERPAHEHLQGMDAENPGHRYGTRASALCGHRSIFEQLAVTAGGMRQRVEIDQRRAAREEAEG